MFYQRLLFLDTETPDQVVRRWIYVCVSLPLVCVRAHVQSRAGIIALDPPLWSIFVFPNKLSLSLSLSRSLALALALSLSLSLSRSRSHGCMHRRLRAHTAHVHTRVHLKQHQSRRREGWHSRQESDEARVTRLHHEMFAIQSSTTKIQLPPTHTHSMIPHSTTK